MEAGLAGGAAGTLKCSDMDIVVPETLAAALTEGEKHMYYYMVRVRWTVKGEPSGCFLGFAVKPKFVFR